MSDRRTEPPHPVGARREQGRACSPAWSGLFARRGFNIYSLAVAPTDDERFSRITIVVDVESAPLEQMVKQLVQADQRREDHRARPARLGRARAAARHGRGAAPRSRGQVIELVQIFEGRILAVGHDALTVSLEGAPDKLDDFEELLRPLWHRRAAAHRPGRAAEARPRARPPAHRRRGKAG